MDWWLYLVCSLEQTPTLGWHFSLNWRYDILHWIGVVIIDTRLESIMLWASISWWWLQRLVVETSARTLFHWIGVIMVQWWVEAAFDVVFVGNTPALVLSVALYWHFFCSSLLLSSRLSSSNSFPRRISDHPEPPSRLFSPLATTTHASIVSHEKIYCSSLSPRGLASFIAVRN